MAFAAFLVGGSDTSPNEMKSFSVSIFVFRSSALRLLACSARISLNRFAVVEPGAISSVSWTFPATIIVGSGSSVCPQELATPDTAGFALSSCKSGSEILQESALSWRLPSAGSAPSACGCMLP